MLGTLTLPPIRPVAELTDEMSGRRLFVSSSQPGVQVYTANWLSLPVSEEITTSTVGHPDHPFVQHNAICLETQHLVDSINHPSFPTVLLNPDQEYHQRCQLKFQLV